jgi:hypothetical protein
MLELALGTEVGSQMRKIAPSRLDPERMSADSRIQEVASLLSVGFLLYWLRNTADAGEKDLAIFRTSSDVCIKPTSEGESL